LVLQKVRLAALATEARRRSRRMEDARPAKVVVAERVIIWCFLVLSGAPLAWFAGGICCRDGPLWTAGMGAGAV